ncbi:phosphoribosylformylglycinamidine synthase I [Candidatus Roizmanbacteria bacterium RIFCSPHIGHO2_12_FULL_41_11]|uniref:Phosphoribosylformylglycinamidine synthase I n=1 Tax=Candidatus Roizmanbacteria bacterium RIFCSPHIGHO2_12_FULL_41_11 TaxID=1802052 RepID=A0A1F7I5Z6_9BACT|nr:MAG: phosphoribosylformylglycinamidine synthase I [Candidatus Roizmanbacteria bacterium RIFCSPHIGHO2_12_FULL_41_11]
MVKPRVLIMAGYGLNCESETKFAFETAGAKADIIHINDLIAGLAKLKNYQIMAFPGGFSYGDDTGSGNAYANRLRNHLWLKLTSFVKNDKLVIGICNGFQILVNLGLLPALNKRYGKREVALVHNDSARYTVRWVDLKVINQSPWLMNMTTLSLPIAHGEGRFYADNQVMQKLNEKKLIALKYVKGEIYKAQQLPSNPNGALQDIAGITDESGRIFGLMPHPERAIFFTHLPHWTLLKETYLREGKNLPTNGPGLPIFQNAVNYFQK